MKRNRKVNKCIKWLACLLALFCVTGTAWAGSSIEPDRTGKLTITYPCGDASFSLYRTAEVSADGTYRWTGDFRGYSLSLSDRDEDGWKETASKLYAYIRRDELKPFRRETADSQGTLVFDRLPTGLYLVAGEPCRMGNTSYTSLPFLISLPGLNGNQKWEYEIAAAPKYEKETHTTPPPESSTPNRPNTPGTPNTGGPSEPPRKLPQTGQLWWPVPLLAVCGLTLLTAGLWVQRKRK